MLAGDGAARRPERSREAGDGAAVPDPGDDGPDLAGDGAGGDGRGTRGWNRGRGGG